MSSCKKYRLLLSRDLDGDLSGIEQAELEAHISGCPDCLKVRDAYSKIHLLLKSAAVAERENGFLERGMHQRSRKVFAFRPVLFRMAAVLVFAFALFLTFSPKQKVSVSGHTLLVADSCASSLMNNPIGAIAYYRHYAGQCIQSQFFAVVDAPVSTFQASATDTSCLSYRSALFSESGIWDQQYASVMNLTD